MTEPRPKLISFAISHYCEKARWALDWYGIDYREEFWPIGLHVEMARKLGAPDSSVPILQFADEVIQGSQEILDWAYRNRTVPKKSLEDRQHNRQVREIEDRADAFIGVQVRRLLYAETLTQHPDIILELLYGNLDKRVRAVGHKLWPRIQTAMIDTLDAAPEAAEDARAKLDKELDWLDEKLAEGRRYLVGDHLTRADLAVASLLGALSSLSRERMFKNVDVPPEIEAEFARLGKRPCMQWVEQIYRDFR